MKTKITIEIETDKLKLYKIKTEELSKEQERELHDKFHNYINEEIIQSEEFEHNFFNYWFHNAEYLNPKVKGFCDIGNLKITVSQEEINN